MFLRRNRRVVDGECYDYWTLVKTVHTAQGPRQELVATLGKEPGLESRSRHGWEAVVDLLDGRSLAQQGELGQALTAEAPAQWAPVDLRGVRVERVREFGQVYLALALWRRLGLHTLLREILKTGQEEVPWDLTACILTVARFCAQRSELEVAERWYADSALEDLLGVSWSQVNDSRLYRGLDVLHAHKERLCSHLLERYRDGFGVQFEFLLYDVTSTYFEGQALGNAKAARGYPNSKASVRPRRSTSSLGSSHTQNGLALWCSARTLGKRGSDLKNMPTAFALAAWHSNLQIDGVKTNRQSLHTPRPFALANHVPAPALRAKVKLVQRLDRHKHTTPFHLRPGRAITLRNTKNLV